MVEIHGDATSTARNMTRPLSSDDNRKTEVLHELQGSFYFEKNLPATSVGMNYVLTLPASFIEMHGDKLQKSVILRSESSARAWNINLSLFFKKSGSAQVRFTDGWREFVLFNDLSEGDSLIFSLEANSEFKVYMFHKMAGNPKQIPCRKRSNCDPKLSRKQAKRPRACKDDGLAAKGDPEGPATKTEERSVSAFSPSLTSSIIDLDLLSESENVHDSSAGDLLNGYEPAINHEKLDMASNSLDPAQHTGSRMKKGNEFRAELAPEKTTRNLQLPSFCTKLTMTNIYGTSSPLTKWRKKRASRIRLEIPQGFWKTHSTRLCSLVKLQGIREDSPIRTVACLLASENNGNCWRLFLRTGWSDFRAENKLKVGQELEFTLLADSFFVVRLVK